MTCRPRLTLSIVIAATCLASASAPALAKTDGAPDWVHAAAAQHLPVYPTDTRAVVLLDETTLLVAPTGRASEHHRRIVKILRPQGRDEATVFLPFSNDEKLSNLHVWSIGPDGHEYALKDKEISEIGFPGQGNFYEDIRARVVRAPGSDPGGIVAAEYDQALPPYLNQTDWEFQEDIPSLQQNFTVELPPGFTYSSVWAHHPAVTPADLENQRWRWTLANVSPVDLRHDNFVPSAASLRGRMTLHFSGPGVHQVGDTWPGIGQWYSRLIADRLTPSPDLTAKAQQLAGASTDFFDRVRPIAEWVQTDVRYFVIERGIGGLQPHPAAEIFHNRFGDCKDKATLLSAMLAAVGLHSDLVLVDSRRGVVDAQAPSLYGNHAIAAIQIPDGYTSPKLRSVVTLADGRRYLIFDPTWEKTPFGQLEHNLQGSNGILIEGARSQLIRLPVLAPDLNRIQRSATLELAADGSLSGSVTEQRFGDSAVDRRYNYSADTEEQRLKFLDDLLSQDLPQFTIADLKITNLDTLNQDLTTSFHLTAAHFARSAGPLLMVRPRVFGSEDLLGVLHDERGDKEIPVDLHATLQSRDDFKIVLPPGYTADELPDPVSLDTDFATYHSAATVRDGTLQFIRSLTIRTVSLPSDRFADLQRLAQAIAADENSTAVLKKSSSPTP